MKQFKNQSILSVDQFPPETLLKFMHYCKNFRPYHKLNHSHISTNLFYEPSTRTSSSFFSAFCKLGGSVNQINDVNFSSVIKGENLEDTIRTLECYSDIIVLRHKENGAAKLASQYAKIPIINAGDGTNEHPSQSLLDSFTIYQKFNTFDNLKIAFMGDLKYGRTVHSLVKLLRPFNIQFYFLAPDEFQLPVELRIKKDIITEFNDEILKELDVLYVTRYQVERFKEEFSSNKFDFLKQSTVITDDRLNTMPINSLLMHPLPRVGEIAPECDNNPRTAYFNQMRNGLHIRMALFDIIL